MQIRSCWLFMLFLTFAPWASAMQSSNLVGTWVGKVQGYGVEMRFVLNADGSADYEGVVGSWRAQGNRLMLTQEGETVVYNFTLQGARLTFSGGDLMAPMVMTRVGGGEIARAPVPALPKPEEGFETTTPPVKDSRTGTQPKPPASRPTRGRRGLSEQEVANLLEGGVSSRRIIELVEERGVDFAVSPASVSRLKAKGATGALVGALQQAEDRSGAGTAGVPSQTNPLAGSASGGRAVSADGGGFVPRPAIQS